MTEESRRGKFTKRIPGVNEVEKRSNGKPDYNGEVETKLFSGFSTMNSIMCMVADDSFVYLAHYDGTISVWKNNENNFHNVKSWKAHRDCIRTIVLTKINNDFFLISGADDHNVCIWTTTGINAGRFTGSSWVYSIIQWDSSRIICGDKDGVLRLIELKLYLKQVETQVKSYHHTSYGTTKFLLAASNKFLWVAFPASVVIFTVSSSFNYHKSHTITNVNAFLEGPGLVFCAGNTFIYKFNLEGELLSRWNAVGTAIRKEINCLGGHNDDHIYVWNWNGDLVDVLKSHKQPVSSFAKCGSRLLSGSLDRTVRVWKSM